MHISCLSYTTARCHKCVSIVLLCTTTESALNSYTSTFTIYMLVTDKTSICHTLHYYWFFIIIYIREFSYSRIWMNFKIFLKILKKGVEIRKGFYFMGLIWKLNGNSHQLNIPETITWHTQNKRWSPPSLKTRKEYHRRTDHRHNWSGLMPGSWGRS